MTQFPHLFLGLHPREDALKILQGALFFCALAYALVSRTLSPATRCAVTLSDVRPACYIGVKGESVEAHADGADAGEGTEAVAKSMRLGNEQ